MAERPPSERGAARHKRRALIAVGIVLAKLGIVAIVLVVPSWLAISLGVAHGVGLVVLIATVVVVVLVFRWRGRKPLSVLSHGAQRAHTAVPNWVGERAAKLSKHKGNR